MTEYLGYFLTFVTGGGLTIFANWKISRKSQKVDFADKAVNFMEKENNKYIARIEKLEADVAKLFEFKCERVGCKIRIPSKL